MSMQQQMSRRTIRGLGGLELEDESTKQRRGGGGGRNCNQKTVLWARPLMGCYLVKKKFGTFKLEVLFERTGCTPSSTGLSAPLGTSECMEGLKRDMNGSS
jgi:hypothetical protein